MITVVGAIVGVIGSAGIWIGLAGLTGVRVDERRGRLTRPDRAVLWRVGGAAVAWLAAWWATGWPMAGAVGAAVVVMVPALVSARRGRQAELVKIEALASWAEMLRDTMTAHAGLNQAIAVTARVAPAPIRGAVQALAVRAERTNLGLALRRFAADVADPIADLIVAALVIADERQAQRLTELLSEIASSARQQAAMRMRVDTSRARTYASSQALVAITLTLVVLLLLMSPQFLDPYDDVAGQFVLGIVAALFAGALWGLVQLGRPVQAPRLLASLDEVTWGRRR